MHRTESVRRPDMPAPLRHPYYQSARDEQRAKAREELCAFLDQMAAARARLIGRRILPVVTQ